MNFSRCFSDAANIFKNILILFALFLTVSGTAYPEQADSLTAFSPSLGPEINLFIRFVFGLAIVIILLILTLWLLRYLMRLRTSGMVIDAVDILSIRYFEQKKAIALVKILERVLIVGVSDNSVSLLGELTPEEIVKLKIPAKKDENPFADILKKIISGKDHKTETS